MPSPDRPIRIVTRGSALALAQANMILAQCRAACPEIGFELKIVKTTGDKLQTASLAQEGQALPKGLFTKELEVALLKDQGDLAVHSLKDLPTDLPAGLELGAVSRRADVRDVLIYRDGDKLKENPAKLTSAGIPWRGFCPGLRIEDLPEGAVVATSSTRRKAQLLSLNAHLKLPDIRGNVLTRLQKLKDNPDLDATILALAGISRLHYTITADGWLEGEGVPVGLRAAALDPSVMLPCVGQGAIGIEVRGNDERVAAVCEGLNDFATRQAVLAERAFLAAMGGGCQSPVAAYAEVAGDQLRMRALSFTHGPLRRAEGQGSIDDPAALGQRLAGELKV